MTKKTILFLVFICLQGWHEVTAQTRQQSPDVFQRIGSNEDSQASLAEWRKIPGIELRCIARALNQQGQTLESTLLKGIIPSLINQNPCAHLRNPMDMILQG
jgi:hypothetical protein